jgi:hypothetical protein
MNWYNTFSPAQRNAAFAWLKKRYADGSRTRPTVCDACGQTEGLVEPHSEDYSEPYGDHIGQFGLCYRCHMMIHCRFRARDAWNAYRAAVRVGKRFAAIAGRHFGAFTGQLAGKPVPFTQHEPPKVFVLDNIDAGKYIAHIKACAVGGENRDRSIPSLFDDDQDQ